MKDELKQIFDMEIVEEYLKFEKMRHEDYYKMIYDYGVNLGERIQYTLLNDGLCIYRRCIDIAMYRAIVELGDVEMIQSLPLLESSLTDYFMPDTLEMTKYLVEVYKSDYTTYNLTRYLCEVGRFDILKSLKIEYKHTIKDPYFTPKIGKSKYVNESKGESFMSVSTFLEEGVDRRNFLRLLDYSNESNNDLIIADFEENGEIYCHLRWLQCNTKLLKYFLRKNIDILRMCNIIKMFDIDCASIERQQTMYLHIAVVIGCDVFAIVDGKWKSFSCK